EREPAPRGEREPAPRGEREPAPRGEREPAPRNVREAALAGVREATDAAGACRGADVVLSVNSAADALDALRQGLPGCRPGTVWAELNTAAPAVKLQAAAIAAGVGVEVVDVAIMAPVPGRDLRVPMAASGPTASRFRDLINAYGAEVTVVDGPVGAAATRKLLRSVFYKGLAAAAVEALAAARAAGLEDWLDGNIRAELARADAGTLDRLTHGSLAHARRRVDEMAAAADLLDDLGVPARVARASRDWLTDLAGPTAT
ncbi:NAD(P)-dependent oxidoreductase, partial [Asanoa siamensis]|uniref:NAD(P)-dependent oxidoreductase n=1 Tax=Asanoa siamensis TaxID=926357 RepID=UPI001EF1E14E